MIVVGRLRQSPIELEIVVFPIPGGTVSRMIIPLREFILLFSAMDSRIRSLVSFIHSKSSQAPFWRMKRLRTFLL